MDRKPDLSVSAALANGGTLEKAAAITNRASTRTMQLYNPRVTKLASTRSSRS